MSEQPQRKKQRINWAPYLLLLPSTLFLVIFFAWPMFRSLVLAFRAEETILNVHEEPAAGSDVVGQFNQSQQITILGNRGIEVTLPDDPEAAEEIDAAIWYRISGEDMDGAAFEGWVPDSYIREDEGETPATSGIVRRRDRVVRSEPGPISPEITMVAEDAAVQILEQRPIDVWFEVEGPDRNGDPITGWVNSSFIEVLSTTGDTISGFVNKGDAGQWTLQYIERMINDRDFWPALRTTLLLLALILPIQFVLAFIMALVLQSQLKGNTIFLYIYAIPLATSDLAVGIVWFSIFTQSGFLNSLLVNLGLIETPIVFLSPNTTYYMILAVVLAEVWRATSIVMVIIVSGLQAIPRDYLEAAELFGAGLWQRVRYVILPLLKNSLQVALILRTILAFQVFGVVIAIAGRGLTVLANETYRWYVEFRNPNVAAAYAGFILLISMITAIFYLRSIRTQEEQA